MGTGERKTKGSPQFAATNLCGVIALPVVASVPSGELETQHRVPTGLWFAESSHGTACEMFQAGKAEVSVVHGDPVYT